MYVIMKKPKLILFFLLILIFVNNSCTDYRFEEYTYKGKGRAHANKNNEIWNCYASCKPELNVGKDTLNISLFNLDILGYSTISLHFSYINKKVGKYHLNKNNFKQNNLTKNPTASFFISEVGDGLIEDFTIYSEDTNNYFKITEIDTINKLFRGEFNVFLTSDSLYSDTLRISNGWFEIPYK